MQHSIIESPKGTITIINDPDLVISDVRSFLDVMFSTEHNTVVLKKENFDPSFFDLKSGLAGDLLQRVSNYRKRLIIIGDFRNLTSKSLSDFIYESNRHGQVIFSGDVENAITLLKLVLFPGQNISDPEHLLQYSLKLIHPSSRRF